MISKVRHVCYLKSRKNFNPIPGTFGDIHFFLSLCINVYICMYFPPKIELYVTVFSLFCSVIFQGYVSVSVYNFTFGMLTAGYSVFGCALICK